MEVLRLEKVFYRYGWTAPWVLNGVDLVVRAGERIGIEGDNGAGKSTMARLLLGLFRPCQGKVKLFGNDVSSRNHYAALGYIGDPSSVERSLPSETRLDDLLNVYAKLFNCAPRAAPYLEDLADGLELRASRLRQQEIRQMSDGQLQRVVAFLALAKGPRLLIADEPTKGLDKPSKKLILNHIPRIAAAENMALMWISHNPEEIAKLAEVCTLEQGRLTRRRLPRYDCSILSNKEKRCYGNEPPATIQDELAQMLIDPCTEKLDLHAEKCNDRDSVADA